ncbi:MAG: DUF3836 domain-containing protein [Bacteroides sp.]|nr:DUF3836 domain-containing protein [Bacteroides sp.]
MKANVFFKAVCVAVIIMATATPVRANNPYVANDIVKEGKVVTRFIYKNDQGLQYHLKSDFTYDAENRLNTKESFLWNPRKQQWIPQQRIQYKYTDSNILITGSSWNEFRKAYTESIRQSIYPIRAAGSKIAQLTAD